jgi:hypothetical protein
LIFSICSGVFSACDRLTLGSRMFNHDLRLTESELDGYPDLGEFLNWANLRLAFEQHDKPANHRKSCSRVWGVRAVALGFLALLVAAIDPLVHGQASRWALTTLAFVLAFAAVGSVALGGALWGVSKEDWLHHRAATERLRQLHFQWLVRRAHFIAARTTGEDKRKLLDERERLLIRLSAKLEVGRAPVVQDIIEDLAGRNTWLVDPGHAGLQDRPTPEVLQQFCEAYFELRIEHQSNYATKKLTPGPGFWPWAPKGQEDRLELFALLATSLLVGMHLLVLVLILWSLVSSRAVETWITWSGSVAMIAAFVILAVRVFADGLRPRQEVARYRRYRAELAEIDRRFKEAGEQLSEKFELMERLEELSYRELREFLTDYREASFVL